MQNDGLALSWELSSSSSETSSESEPSPLAEDGQDNPNVLATASGLGRRGRACGQLSRSMREWRDKLLSQAGCLRDAVVKDKSEEIAGDRAATKVDPEVAMLRSVGSPCYNKIVGVVRDSFLEQKPGSDPTLERFLRAFLLEPRMLTGRVAEAHYLHMDRRTMKRRILEAASLGYITSRMYASSVFSHLLRAVAQEKITIANVTCAISWDETPLPMKACAVKAQRRVSMETPGFALPKDTKAVMESHELRDLNDKGTMKVVQTSVSVTVVFRELEDSNVQCWVLPIVCPLSIVDRATGPALQAVLSEHASLPVLGELRQAATLNQDICIRDSAAANIVSDEIGYAKGGDNLRLPVGCAAHGVSNAQRYSFAAVKEMITGVISCSLAQRPGGSVPLLRAAIVEVLLRRVEVRRGFVLRSNDSRVSYKDAVLDLCVKKDAAGLARRANLQLLMNGDWQLDAVHLYISAGQDVDLRKWAVSVATLLLPSAIEVFPRRVFFNHPHSLRKLDAPSESILLLCKSE